MRRLAIALVGIGAVMAFAPPAGAQDETATTVGPTSTAAESGTAPFDLAGDLAPVDVFEVSGWIDPILADEIERAVGRAESEGSQALILQMNSPGALVSVDRMEELATQIADSAVPVAIWVGPSNARALGLSGQLLGVASVTAMAPGARIGNFGDPLEVNGQAVEFGEASAVLRRSTLGFQDARRGGALKLDISDEGVPVLRNMVLALDGLEYGDTVLDTAVDTIGEEGTARQSITTPRLFKLGLVPRLFHTVASPPVAYLLFIIGASLLIFEFFTAGIGVAGSVGMVCLVLGCYGFGVLPMRGWALVLLCLSMLALAVDAQVGIPRVWTGLGLVMFAVASLWLYRAPVVRMPWITLIACVGGMALAFVVGMPSMVRTRFATPTIGREWMLGSIGEAVVAVDPDGIVTVDGAQWRARTNRATPIGRGEPVRVVGIDGVTLEVEPPEGGAKDYRDRSRSPGVHSSEHSG